MKRYCHAALVLFAALPETAFAQDVGEQPRTLESVAVQGIRNPQEFKLSDGLRLVRRFESIPAERRDKIGLSFYAQGKTGPIDPAGLALDVVTADGDIPVEVLSSARLLLPHVPSDQAERAIIVANVRKGAMSIIYKVDIVPPTSQPMTLNYLKEAASQATTGWKTVYNKMAAMTVPIFTCAEFEFATPQQVAVLEGERKLWASPLAHKVRVPLSVEGASGLSNLAWSPDQLVRIGGCKMKSGS